MKTSTLRSQNERLWLHAPYLFFALVCWAVICSVFQGGWDGFWAFCKTYGAVATAIVVVATVFQYLRQHGLAALLTTASLLLLGFWVWLADRWNDRLWDLFAAVVALLGTVMVLRFQSRHRSANTALSQGLFPTIATRNTILIFTLFFWGIASILVSLRSVPLPINPARFADFRPEQALLPDQASRWADLRIGVALSGGGYRAAVYHAGVLQGLEELGIKPTNISTVSGGSIIGAYYAVGGEPAAFVQAVADGHFNLKRRLMQVQNALRLPLPMKIPGLETELFPFIQFDRLDVQANLLDDLLFARANFDGNLPTNGLSAEQPLLMIATTDLNYGFQLGLLHDGFLKLGHNGEWDVYRNSVVEYTPHLDLAERVAISGAFPLAFPPRPLKTRVKSFSASGLGLRELLLIDGGIRDNTGYDLLRAADFKSRKEGRKEVSVDGTKISDYQTPPNWKLDAALVSNAGAVFGVLEGRGNALSLLPRMFDIGAIETDGPNGLDDSCAALLNSPPHISPVLEVIDPDRQFNLKNENVRRAALEEPLSINFSPGWYPYPIIEKVTELLPETDRNVATAQLEVLKPIWDDHVRVQSDFTRDVRKAMQTGECALKSDGVVPQKLPDPGVCEVIIFREVVRGAVRRDLEVFVNTSTLDDTLHPKTVRAIERLGKMLTYIKWNSLERHLNRAIACRDQTRSGTATILNRADRTSTKN